jgi:hypothetical protein
MSVEEGKKLLAAHPEGHRRRFRITPDGQIIDKAEK